MRKLAGVISSTTPAPLESLPNTLSVADTFCSLEYVTESSASSLVFTELAAR